MTLTTAAPEEAPVAAAAAPPLQPLDTQSSNKRRRASATGRRTSGAASPTPTLLAKQQPPHHHHHQQQQQHHHHHQQQQQQQPEQQEKEKEAPVVDSSSGVTSPATVPASSPPASEAAAADVHEAAVHEREPMDEEAAALLAQEQMRALFFDDGDDEEEGEGASGGYQYKPSARRVAEDKGEWTLLCSSDEEEGGDEDSDLSDSDYDSDGGPRKRAKKRRPLRLGLRTTGQMHAALDADPAWGGLGVLARFLREGVRFDEDQEQQEEGPGQAAAMDVVETEAEGGQTQEQQEHPPPAEPAPAPEAEEVAAASTAAAAPAAEPTATAMEQEAEEVQEQAQPQEQEEEEQMSPAAAAEARAAMVWHLRPRPMCPPFKEEEMGAIQERAKVLEANKKPPLEERRPPPYKKIRRMQFHESMKDRTHIFREDGQDAQCECVEEGAGAAPEQQQQQPPSATKKGRGRPKKQEQQEGRQSPTPAQEQGEEGEGNEEDGGVLCGPGCINRSLHVECTAATCRFAQAGKCRNQRIAKREGKAFEVFRTDCRGWGVRAGEDIRPGSYIMEYVGEVIDDEEVARRMWASKQEEAENYYMVEMQGATVDARDYGNEARFVNHSCEPNCSLQKWLVDGSYRLAIFSIKPIKQGEELTWDYNFASFGEPKPCLCGAPSCRKILSGKPQREEAPQPQLTAKGQQTQREAAAAESFRRRVLAKPGVHLSDLVLFFNGRTSKGEMARARDRRLWLTTDGNGNVNATDKRARRTLGQAVEAARARMMAVSEEQGEEDAMAKIVGELEEMATAHAATPADPALSRPCRRLGLLSLREKRWGEAHGMAFAKGLVGEERVGAWPEHRRAAIEDMVVFMRTSETPGLLADLNEDVCYNCSCSGDLLCCDACTAAFHLSCAGLWQLPEEDTWLCNRCKKGAARSKRAGGPA